MTAFSLPLPNAPIIEAVVDINCDLPVGTDLVALEPAAKEAYSERYPQARRRLDQQVEFRQEADAPPESSFTQAVGALQFVAPDGKQLMQVRSEGFTFNRLAPYGSLDEYLPEVEDGWRRFVEIARPVQVKRVGLRFINRLMLPMVEERLDFSDYLRFGPRLPDGGLLFASFVHQYAAVEPGTENRVNMALVTQAQEGMHLPVIFDIDAFRLVSHVPEDWDAIRKDILALRELKNRIFLDSLTEKCLSLFQQQ